MTPKQERLIEYIRKNYVAIMHGEAYTATNELKRFEVTELGVGGIVSLVAESGLVGDEGTMAAIFARNRIHIFIGPKGGIKYYNKRQTLKRGNRRLLYSIYCDQAHN